MKIAEIFNSISGEVGGLINQGECTTFIRTNGCTVGCLWCDTPKTQRDFNGTEMSVDTVISEALSFQCPNVIITGGEPALQSDLEKLVTSCARNFQKVAIETSGMYDISYLSDISENIAFCVDFKLPSAGIDAPHNFFPYHTLGKKDVINFPIVDDVDLDIAMTITTQIKTMFHRDKSPIFSYSPLKERMARKIFVALQEKNPSGVLNIQIHKVLSFR